MRLFCYSPKAHLSKIFLFSSSFYIPRASFISGSPIT